MYHDGVVYGVSLLNFFLKKKFIKKIKFVSSTELREWLREKHPTAVSSF